MGALIGLGIGIGLTLIWSAFFVPRSPRTRTRRAGRLRELLDRAGLGQVSTTGFVILCVVVGLGATSVIQLVSGTPPVAIAFGLMG
ncbi:MAG TPA: type II secretion system protein F, partial [Nocardioides sp.]|nr:type II secretion system protein F [Nocardioides sp.]